MTRNKHFRSVFAALLCAVLCMTAFATVAYADGGDYYDDELPPETWQEETQPEDNTIVPGTPFTEDGIAATRDLLYDKHTNKQFITVETRNGHTLYIVIDYDIQAYHEYYAKDESWKNFVLHNEGTEAWEKDKAERETLLTEFVPYMRLHCNLSEQERTAADSRTFEVIGHSVCIDDETLAEAISALPVDRRDIILLSYFLDMSDAEIANVLNMVRRSVAYRRTSTLKLLKNLMGGKNR